MKKILIIGAGFLQDFVICKAKELGYEVLAVDADENAIGFQHADRYAVVNITDENRCLEYAKKEQIDGVLTAATEYGVLTAAYIAQEMNLPGIPYETAKLIKNKYRVRKCLLDHHVDDMGQVFEATEDTDFDTLSRKVLYPVIVKPCDGSGSRGASKVDRREDFEAACKAAIDSSASRCAEIETFYAGQEYGAESLVVNGEVHVLGIMKKWMTKPPYYAELGHGFPNDLPSEIEERAKTCVKQAIQVLGITCGSVNMDLIITAEGRIHIVDVGARMGGNMIGPCIIPYGTGIEYMEAMLKNAVGDKVDWTVKEHGAVATRLLAFHKDMVIEKLPDFERLKVQYGVEIYHHMEAGQEVHTYHTNLDGCGYIVARDMRIEDAVCKADTVLNIILEGEKDHE